MCRKDEYVLFTEWDNASMTFSGFVEKNPMSGFHGFQACPFDTEDEAMAELESQAAEAYREGYGRV